LSKHHALWRVHRSSELLHVGVCTAVKLGIYVNRNCNKMACRIPVVWSVWQGNLESLGASSRFAETNKIGATTCTSPHYWRAIACPNELPKRLASIANSRVALPLVHAVPHVNERVKLATLVLARVIRDYAQRHMRADQSRTLPYTCAAAMHNVLCARSGIVFTAAAFRSLSGDAVLAPFVAFITSLNACEHPYEVVEFLDDYIKESRLCDTISSHHFTRNELNWCSSYAPQAPAEWGGPFCPHPRSFDGTKI
jgi:hypothetical protein